MKKCVVLTIFCYVFLGWYALHVGAHTDEGRIFVLPTESSYYSIVSLREYVVEVIMW